jgi:hypothetical protein
MADVIGKVLSAFVASGLLVLSALLEDLHTAGIEIRPRSKEAPFLDDLQPLRPAEPEDRSCSK